MTLVTSSPDVRFQTSLGKTGIRVGRADEKPRKGETAPAFQEMRFFLEK
jgi:hypothetical protein